MTPFGLLFRSAVWASLLAASGPLQPPLVVTFDWPASVQAGVRRPEVTLELAPVAPEGSGDPLRRQVPGGDTVELSVAAGQRYRLSARAVGYWAADLELKANAEATPIRVRFLPSGRLKATLVPPRDTVAPVTSEMRIDASLGAKQPHDFPTAFATCPIAQNQLVCDLPAGTLDVRLRLEGFATHYAWGVPVPAGEALDLGKIALQPGSSVTGWVGLAEGGAALGAEVELAQEEAGAVLDALPRQQLQRLALTARANERGFFQFAGVPPGIYEARIRLDGFAPRTVGPIEVKPGLESQIQDRIVLDHPATVEVLPQPPIDPYGRPWVVTVVQQDDLQKKIHRATAAAEGVFRLTGLPPGLYRLELSDVDGGHWIIEEQRLSPGINRLPLEVPVVEVRGRALIGDEPLAARLQFHAENQRAARVRLDADLDGRFEGYLPFEGTWGVRLTSEEERMSVSLPPLEIRRLPGKSYAEVTVQVPDTRLEGRVLDPAGAPVADADVRAFPDFGTKGQNAAGTDRNGVFHFRGLPEGNYTVTARREEQDSDSVPVSLDEDLDSPEITLVLRSVRDVTGVVQSYGRRIPGARVLVIPDMSSSAVGSPVETYTGAGGVFRAKLPADSAFLTFLVAAPSHAIHIARAPFALPGQQIVLEVESASGTLSLGAFMGRPQGPGGRIPMPIVFHNGAAVPLPLLLNLTGASRSLGLASPDPFEIAHLEPGEYTACIGKLATRAWREGASAPREGCARGLLQPYARLELAPPAPVVTASP